MFSLMQTFGQVCLITRSNIQVIETANNVDEAVRELPDANLVSLLGETEIN